MAKIIYDGIINDSLLLPENKICQGDFVFCDAYGSGALSFWGIFSTELGVIALDGAGANYFPKKTDLYLYEKYSYWRITKRIKQNVAEIIIKER